VRPVYEGSSRLGVLVGVLPLSVFDILLLSYNLGVEALKFVPVPSAQSILL